MSPKIHTDLLWDLTLLFVVLCGLYFGVIFFFRRKLSVGSKAVGRRKKELSPMISEFLFYDENAPKEEKTNYVNLKIEIRELLNHSANRKVLTDVLMDLRKDLSGNTLGKLFELYEGLGLHHDSYKKLESWRWQRISKGILELTQMHVEESYVFVTKFINDKRSTIRKQAEIAIITLHQEGLNFFLDTTTYRISEWQQLKIMEVLKNKKNYQPPSFKQWLISKNKDVVLFALRLMKHYNQSDGNQALIELLKHKNGEIKVAAIDCIKEFHVVEAIETLKLVFWNSSTDIKIAILDAIASLGNEGDIEFLSAVSVKESNFNVKSKALGSINAIAPMSVMPTVGIQKVNSFKVPKDLGAEALNEDKTGIIVTQETVVKRLQEEPELEQKDSNSSAETIINQEEQVLHVKETTAEISVENRKLFEIPVDIDSESELDSATNEVEQTYAFKVDFLPFVTQKSEAVKTQKYHPAKNYTDSIQSLNDLAVVFDEVLSTTEEPKDNKKTAMPIEQENDIDFSSEVTSLDFLPIVVPSKEITKRHGFDLSNIEVDYSEIEINTPKENKILSELNALVPLPRLPKEITQDISNVNQESEKPTSTKNIDMKKIRKIECEGVEIKNEDKQGLNEEQSIIASEASQELQDFVEQEAQNTLDWLLAVNEAQGELKQKIKSIVNKEDEITFKFPKPIILEGEGSETIALLDDIEALGDNREVPLLEHMLLSEKELSIRERIKDILEKISETSVLKREPIPQDDEVFSVFEEFFKRVDIPSKLILLDEIVAVGDEKEIPFLKSLVEGSTKKIRKKAGICLEQLTARLVKEEETEAAEHKEDNLEIEENSNEIISLDPESPTEKPFSLFDIDFDLSFEGREETESKTSS